MLRAVLLAVALAAARSSELARGWGESINWQPLEAAQAEARATQRPLMVVIHKSWCGACKALKPLFAASAEVAALAPRFAMVNALDDEEPKAEDFAPDAGYNPRIIFFSPNGTLIRDAVHVGATQYKYFYSDPKDIAVTMSSVADAAATAELDAAPPALDVSDL